jgi:hypothetical protein
MAAPARHLVGWSGDRLNKPYDRERLAVKLRRALNGSAGEAEATARIS